MRVLVTRDVDTSGQGNPFGIQLLRALELHPGTEAVQHGTAWMYMPEVAFDVVHVQWPEALFEWQEPARDQMETLEKALLRWREQGIVVATVHNDHPHYEDTKIFRELYHLVYQNVDGVIHMGQASKQAMRVRYQSEMESAEETVIPHGDYSWFPNQITRSQARARLNIPEEENMILCFGALRHPEELRMLVKGFKKVSLPDTRLLIAGRLPYRRRTHWRHFHIRWRLGITPNVHVHEKRIPVDDVQLFMQAADVLVIPRKQALNSGNVALGFTFGKVVVGPEHGVIGETLRQTGNPVFDPDQPEQLGEALSRGIQLAREEKGKQNLRFAERNLQWRTIADQHVAFYERLRKKRSQSLALQCG